MGCSVSREKVDFFEPETPCSFISIDLEEDSKDSKDLTKDKKIKVNHFDSFVIFEKKTNKKK
tara:strand:- start:23397 stop:23582 length:186 start_codon:yes stop_codon:yes gene_type:complete